MPMTLGMGMGLPSGQGGGSFSPDTIPSLAAWFDAADIATITLDESSRVSAWKCKKTGNSVSQSTDTKRPAYNATSKQIEIVAANSTYLGNETFFPTGSYFKDAAWGNGKAMTIIVVCTTNIVNITFGASYCGIVSSTLRSGSGANKGGTVQFNTSASKTCHIFSKPIVTDTTNHKTWILDTFNTELASCVPIPVYFKNREKQTSANGVVQATVNGTAYTTGGLEIGGWSNFVADRYYQNSQVHEFLMFSEALSESNILLLVNYLCKKWGIA